MQLTRSFSLKEFTESAQAMWLWSKGWQHKQAGTQPVPSGFEDVEPLLPALEWPL